jgi:hypothetical protein
VEPIQIKQAEVQPNYEILLSNEKVQIIAVPPYLQEIQSKIPKEYLQP